MSFPSNIGSYRNAGPMPVPATQFTAGNSVGGLQIVSQFIAYQIGMWNTNGSLGPGLPVDTQTTIAAYRGSNGMDPGTARTAATQFYTWEAQGTSEAQGASRLNANGDSGGLARGGQGGVVQSTVTAGSLGQGVQVGGLKPAGPRPFRW